MIKPMDESRWLQYRSLLSPGRELYSIPLPSNLPHQGSIDGSFGYVLPERLLRRLRAWLDKRQCEAIFLFMTEYTGKKKSEGFFEIPLADLTEQELMQLHIPFPNVLTSRAFDWALYIDHEGNLHVAGPGDLLSELQAEDNSIRP